MKPPYSDSGIMYHYAIAAACRIGDHDAAELLHLHLRAEHPPIADEPQLAEAFGLFRQHGLLGDGRRGKLPTDFCYVGDGYSVAVYKEAVYAVRQGYVCPMPLSVSRQKDAKRTLNSWSAAVAEMPRQGMVLRVAKKYSETFCVLGNNST